jgi:putative DNA primase/helicase
MSPEAPPVPPFLGAQEFLKMAPHIKPTEQAMDPHKLARCYLDNFGKDPQRRIALRYSRGDWWRWADGRYTKVDRDELKAQMTDAIKRHVDRVPLLDQHGRAYPVTGSVVANITQALASLTLVASALEQPAWLGDQPSTIQYLSVGNGLLNIEEAQNGSPYALCRHTPYWFSTVYTPVMFEPKAACPRWTQFLNEALECDPERIAIVQEFFGYCLTPDARFQTFLIVEGEGANGKSVLLDTLGNLLGPGNVSHLPLEAFGERFQLGATQGKLANISPEVDNVRLSEGIIKQFVGGDAVYVDRKGLAPISFRPTARLVISTNNKPTINDRSNGFWRRALLVPFRVAVAPEKRVRDLADKVLRAELSGILNWSLVGRRRLYLQDGFTESTVAKEAADRYRASSNPEREFLTDCYEVGLAAEFVVKADVYGQYKVWAESQGHKVLDAGAFATEVKRAFPQVTDPRLTIDGKRPRVWQGIRASKEVEISAPIAA